MYVIVSRRVLSMLEAFLKDMENFHESLVGEVAVCESSAISICFQKLFVRYRGGHGASVSKRSLFKKQNAAGPGGTRLAFLLVGCGEFEIATLQPGPSDSLCERDLFRVHDHGFEDLGRSDPRKCIPDSVQAMEVHAQRAAARAAARSMAEQVQMRVCWSGGVAFRASPPGKRAR